MIYSPIIHRLARFSPHRKVIPRRAQLSEAEKGPMGEPRCIQLRSFTAKVPYSTDPSVLRWFLDLTTPVPTSCKVTACLLAQHSQFAYPGASQRGRAHQSVPVGNGVGVGKVASSTVSSKLSSGKWPRPDGVASKVIRILQQWGVFGEQQLSSQPHHEPPPEHKDPLDASPTTGEPGSKLVVSSGDSAAPVSRTSHEMNTTGPPLGPASLGAGSGEKKDGQHPTTAVSSDRQKETAASSETMQAEIGEGGQEKDGISTRPVQSLDTTGVLTLRKPLDVADEAAKEAVTGGTRDSPAADVFETFSLRVEDAVAEVRGSILSHSADVLSIWQK